MFPNMFSGYWKATGPNKLIGRGTQVADVCRGTSKGKFSIFSKFENVGKFPLENPLQKSATCVPLPINLFGPVALQYIQEASEKKTEHFIWKILYENRQLVYPYL